MGKFRELRKIKSEKPCDIPHGRGKIGNVWMSGKGRGDLNPFLSPGGVTLERVTLPSTQTGWDVKLE